LTAANGIDHGQAHDALSDVRATIALARLIREKQPKLYDWLFQLRTKQRVLDQVRLLQPMVHISGRFSAARHYIGVVLPLAWHPKNRNALIVYDLHFDPQPLMDLEAESLRALLYTRREELAEGQLPIGLKLIHVNRCPVVAPLTVVRAQDQQRLQVDMADYQARARVLTEAQEVWQQKLNVIYAREDFTPSEDPEQQLYDGFLGDRDRRLCEQVRLSDPEQLGKDTWPFDDERLPELLFRYRARNFPATLSEQEHERWQLFCQQRLTDPAFGAPLTLSQFNEAVEGLARSATPAQLRLLEQWQRYAQDVSRRVGLVAPATETD
ncbi:MAG: exodeoxyribonuclease I, partial [Pseudomonas sp.]|nr:exodeoxyribonuclease I [Pseudomonas sp.]